MSILQKCYEVYHRHRTEYGKPPTQIHMTEDDYMSLLKETEWMMVPCEDTGRREVCGMKIVIVEGYK